jgi:hypothetical protein
VKQDLKGTAGNSRLRRGVVPFGRRRLTSDTAPALRFWPSHRRTAAASSARVGESARVDLMLVGVLIDQRVELEMDSVAMPDISKQDEKRLVWWRCL